MLPNIWPLFSIINIIRLDEKAAKSVNHTNSYVWYQELVVRYLRLSTYLIVALVIYHFTFPSYSSIQNDSDSGSWWIRWFLIIFIRDQIVTLSFYGGWHYILYQSPLSSKMEKLKFNPKYPAQSQWNHDRFWTLNGAAISSVFELISIRIFKGNGQYLYYGDSPISFILWLLFIPYWRDFHFYWIHRVMHKWNWKLFGVVDIGEVLYKNVHSLHHKSYNTGPWSGLSMHPIEHLLYYSCIWVPGIFGVKQHPIHMLFNKMHAQLSPLPGHDGFDSPGGGSYFHYLHHAHFECNYGTPLVPMDKWFGTYEEGAKYRKEKKYDSTREHAQTPVHTKCS